MFDRQTRHVIAFDGEGRANAAKKVAEIEAELGDAALDELIGDENHRNLMDDIELLDGAADEFDLDAVRAGKLSPVFFGSALTNFGVEPFLKEFLRLAPAPLPYTDTHFGRAWSTRSAMNSPASCSRSRRTWTRTTATASPSCASARASSSAAWMRYHVQGGKQAQAGHGHVA